jgi:hypothetical protein
VSPWPSSHIRLSDSHNDSAKECGQVWKVDADAFADLMGSRSNAPWLLDYQKEWPKYLFHTTHVENAARIVIDGKLLSRDLAL